MQRGGHHNARYRAIYETSTQGSQGPGWAFRHFGIISRHLPHNGPFRTFIRHHRHHNCSVETFIPSFVEVGGIIKRCTVLALRPWLHTKYVCTTANAFAGFIRPTAATERRKLRWRSRQPPNGNVTATETTINYMPVKG